jgi:tritrans,polycis-undecaprenyl-diphosphate synthase [geranylgeranyl-diphosphate specific]
MEVPRHLGIIMDGNRRFAKRLMVKPWKGHEWGAKKLTKVLEWCQELDIRELTVYTFSIQNFDRPKEEFDYLMDNFRSNFDRLKKDKRIYENQIRVNVIGRTYLFPEDIQDQIKEIMDLTKDHSKYTVNFAMAYGGQEEIIDAVKSMASDLKEGNLAVQDIDKASFSKRLYNGDEPDLIIRTGGERRLSNFLSFQSAYSEFIFLDKMWPELEKEDFLTCIQEYGYRKRRFGK